MSHQTAVRALAELLYSAVAVATALAVAGVLIAASGYDVGETLFWLYDGSLGNLYSLANTLLEATPLLFCGAAVAFAFQAGLFNVGAEGQLYLGALATAAAALYSGAAPPVVAVTLSLGAGALAGAAWALVPGVLKARTGAHEVVTTIMFNYVATFLAAYLLKAYLKEPGPVDQTPLVPEAARLPELVPDTRLTVAFLLGIACIAGADWFLRRTVAGYEIRAVGSNPGAAEYAGIHLPARVVLAMVISGALAGLAGATAVLGVHHRFITHFSPGYGFTGIAVAVLGRNRPWGVLPAALLFGALQSGGLSMQLFARIPMDLITVVQGLVILFVAAPVLARMGLGAIRRAWGDRRRRGRLVEPAPWGGGAGQPGRLRGGS